jgi:hypothetical protein
MATKTKKRTKSENMKKPAEVLTNALQAARKRKQAFKK